MKKTKIFPLDLQLCQDCLLGFNATPLTSEQLTDIYDHYLYISPCVGIGQDKYIGMLDTLQKSFDKNDLIVDIGCSEGYLLSKLKELGFTNLIGIEPGPQGEEAKARGFKIIKSYFQNGLFKKNSIDGFCLMHVFEHFERPFTVLAAMKEALKPDGAIVIEVPNLDGLHHQHLFYYSLPFMKRLCKDYNLKIISAVTENVAGRALRVVLTHKRNSRKEYEFIAESAEEIVANAKSRHDRFINQVTRMNQILRQYHGETIFWWGTGSQGVIYLNEIVPSIRERMKLEIVDGDKNKWGYYIPGLGFEVKSHEILRNRSIKCLFIASSLSREILQTTSRINLTADHIEVIGD